jgi:hypothetical protein
VAETQQSSAWTAQAVRESAIGLLIGGGLCLYFGFTLIADAPGSVSKVAAESWYLADNITFWCLRGIGLVFLLTAGAAAVGQTWAMLLAAVAEGLLAALLVGMSVLWTIEARVDNTWNAQVILLLILAILGAGSAARCWRIYKAGRSVAGRGANGS